MEILLIPALLLILVVTVTPIPAFMCFSAAWGKDRNPSRSVFASISIVFVTSVFPIILLAVYGIVFSPTWKVFGTDYAAYMFIGESPWVCLPPFAGANYLIARTALNPDYVGQTPLAQLSLITCLFISIFFTIGTVNGITAGTPNGSAAFLFPGSAACAYGYGLCLLIQRQGLPRIAGKCWLLLFAWVVTLALTVLTAIVRTRHMVDELPEEPTGCFIVTAACKGHPFLVGSYLCDKTDRQSNHQLDSFRKFEQWLEGNAPKLHQTARQKYNIVGPMIARKITHRWQANLTYLALKPMEWIFRLVMPK